MRARAVLLALLACLALGAVAAPAQEIGTYSRVEVGALNLRAAPDTGSSVLGVLPGGTTVSILDRKRGWARVFVRGADGKAVQGWVAARYLGPGAGAAQGHRAEEGAASADSQIASLRVDKLDFDCRAPLFGNSGIRKCVASVRVRLPRREFDPARSDLVSVACRGAVSYRTDEARFSRELMAEERATIARNGRLGQSVRVRFPVRSETDKIVAAQLRSFACWRDRA